jgi:hypothetical protein
MPKKAPKTNFNFSVQEMIDLCNEKKIFIARDTPDFIDYGVTEAVITAFTADITEMENFPTDAEMLGDQQTATEVKEALAAIVRKNIRSILTRAENQYGVDTGKYKSFGARGLSDMDDSKLIKCARTVGRVATKRLAELEGQGLVAGDIVELTDNLKDFVEAEETQADAISERDVKTEERIDTANALYANLIKFCNSGKDMWSTTSEAKYNDYVLYDAPPVVPDVPVV